MKVLLVDDEKDICILLSSILKREGFVTNCAFSVAEARAKMSFEEFEVAFVDLNLPDGVGYQLIPYLKQNPTKVILISAFDVEWEKASREGADYLIKKPFSRDVILTALKDLKLN